MSTDQLIEKIRRGGEGSHEAALTLGLLIEREIANRPANDMGIEEILGEDKTGYRLSSSEIKTAVDQLVQYIDETPDPQPMAVWALTKSFDQRILTHLINLLDRTLLDPTKEHLAYQALVGITIFYNKMSIAAIQRAAEKGHGRVKETAKQYLSVLFRREHGESS